MAGQLTEAMREAYASAPAHQVILHTLELQHPAFLDEKGNAVSIRVVRDYEDMQARLELDAPLQAGEMVWFVAMAFDLRPPSIDDSAIPEIDVTFDNVGQMLMQPLSRAATSQDKIALIYRAYLSDLLDEGPQLTPITLTLTSVEANINTVSGKARMPDYGNKRFPNVLYTLDKFVGLAR